MRKRLSSGFLLLASLLATPAVTHSDQHVTSKVSYKNDPRYLRLKAYFKKRQSPVAGLAADFIAAADRNDLDWRLLPAISIIESGGGQRCKNNNIFGWGSGEIRFASVQEGIHHVARRFASSRIYRDKKLEEILRAYNPYETYPGRVKHVMRLLSPDELTRLETATLIP